MKIASVVMVIAATIGTLFYNLSGGSSGYAVGDVATNFSLKNVDGKMVSLSDYPGAKGYIVIFTCNHCPFSVAYEDRIEALHQRFASQGYPVIAISPSDPKVEPEDSFGKMVIRAKEKGFTFPYLIDDGQKVYPQYGATKTPHVYVLDAARKVQYIGSIDDNVYEPEKVQVRYVEDAIASLQAGNPIRVTMTKAIGCSIKPGK
ncbi:MAG TPA: thioredoxin family protein [Saprospiraceae bacterium]|nr:thioredoxin family protein [Saprospiraceae bacterium]